LGGFPAALETGLRNRNDTPFGEHFCRIEGWWNCPWQADFLVRCSLRQAYSTFEARHNASVKLVVAGCLVELLRPIKPNGFA